MRKNFYFTLYGYKNTKCICGRIIFQSIQVRVCLNRKICTCKVARLNHYIAFWDEGTINNPLHYHHPCGLQQQ